MFVKIHDCCIINTDHVVWVDMAEGKATVKMSDGTEHVVASDKFQEAMNTINNVAKSAAFGK